jgi:hypothetical protein
MIIMKFEMKKLIKDGFILTVSYNSYETGEGFFEVTLNAPYRHGEPVFGSVVTFPTGILPIPNAPWILGLLSPDWVTLSAENVKPELSSMIDHINFRRTSKVALVHPNSFVTQKIPAVEVRLTQYNKEHFYEVYRQTNGTGIITITSMDQPPQLFIPNIMKLALEVLRLYAR